MARGCLQIVRIVFTETYSPAFKMTTFRVLLTLAIHQGWIVKEIDVNNTFLNGDLHEKVYIDPSPSDDSRPAIPCRLTKALYGFKPALCA